MHEKMKITEILILVECITVIYTINNYLLVENNNLSINYFYFLKTM